MSWDNSSGRPKEKSGTPYRGTRRSFGSCEGGTTGMLRAELRQVKLANIQLTRENERLRAMLHEVAPKDDADDGQGSVGSSEGWSLQR